MEISFFLDYFVKIILTVQHSTVGFVLFRSSRLKPLKWIPATILEPYSSLVQAGGRSAFKSLRTLGKGRSSSAELAITRRYSSSESEISMIVKTYWRSTEKSLQRDLVNVIHRAVIEWLILDSLPHCPLARPAFFLRSDTVNCIFK
jgi:hypothetical protein